MLIVVGVDFNSNLVDNLKGIRKGLLEGLDDDDGVDVALELGQSLCEDLSRCPLSALCKGFPAPATHLI